ncbi:iron-containing alcohol dehydrogenase [Planctomicrobium sp. SH527]|uniref:iron-containing alcohol dehydrogenase n=1 Tax=Planctomicrobium sp. SH527 TaxID=3448123 RepID=UPI003F5C284B
MLTTPFDFSPRTRVLYGSGTLGRLGELAKEFGCRRTLLVTDSGLKAAGHEDRAVESLQSAGVQVSVFDDVHPNPTTLDIERGTEFARPLGIDLIVGLGGGSSMDCAKGINFILTNGGRMQDYKGTGLATKPMLPMIAIPTTSGTGSEAQSYAVISDAETHMKMACGDKKALAWAAILDPELTVTMPRGVTAATGVDAISHALETAVTTKRNSISSMFSQQAWKLIFDSLGTVLSEPGNVSARGAMQLGAHFAGAAIENSMLGATHALANPVSAHYETAHGVAIGVLLPYVIQFNARQKEAGRIYAELAQQVGLSAVADESAIPTLVAALRSLIRDAAGQPTTLQECGVNPKMLPQMAQEAAMQWTGTFNPRPVDAQLLLEIYKCAFNGTDVNF